MPRFANSELIQKSPSRWVHIDKLIMLTSAFMYSIVDIVISFEGFSFNDLSDEEKGSYGAVLGFLGSFFMYATLSECLSSHSRYKNSVNKYHRLNLKLDLYQTELAKDKSKICWEYLPFNLKEDLTGGRLLTTEIINKVFPSEGKVDFEMYLFLAWEQYVAKEEKKNKIFHTFQLSNKCCKFPILGSNYALLSMFVVDLVVSVWGLDTFENTKVHYPLIFSSAFLVLMAAGFKLVNWSQKQILANDKPEFLTKKFYKLRSLLEQYRLSQPDVRVEFVRPFSIGLLYESEVVGDGGLNGGLQNSLADSNWMQSSLTGSRELRNPLAGSGELQNSLADSSWMQSSLTGSSRSLNSLTEPLTGDFAA